LNSLEWRNESPYSLDVEAFEHHLTINPGQGQQRETLEQALELYGGELLRGCYEDWIAPLRERLRLAYHSIMEALADMAEAAREYPAALGYTRRLVMADPLHPTANRQLIKGLGGSPRQKQCLSMAAEMTRTYFLYLSGRPTYI
jgi:two-component SAPR family response regulator